MRTIKIGGRSIPTAVVVAVIVGAFVMMRLIAGESDDEDQAEADTTTTTEATTTTTVPEPATAPLVTNALLVRTVEVADESGLSVESIDLRPEVLGNGHRRAQLDHANWRVLGQCPVEGSEMTTADTLYVGVLKTTEAATPAINTGIVERIFDRLVCELSLDEAREQ